jgi:hypothetical protein
MNNNLNKLARGIDEIYYGINDRNGVIVKKI